LGADFIIDTSFARLLSRKLHFEEFSREFLNSEENDSLGRRVILTGVSFLTVSFSNLTFIQLQVCPGFVCYAEKTHGDLLVPIISKVRSPQAITGQLVKSFLRQRLPGSLSVTDIFLVSIQPCFDKKLEASRAEFTLDGQQEVDCVITPSLWGHYL
jgi:iron only hydrogenase large subunit-like protein